MMTRFLRKRSRLGFTLAEMLAVIAILIILIGLGVPGFIALRKSIKITEYDDTAREIYVAAQNRLTQLAANGLEPDEKKALEKGAFIEKPIDFEGALWEDKVYMYTNQSSEPAQIMLPLGSIDDSVRLDGCYFIEYSPKTLMVYSVFYSDSPFDYKTHATNPYFRKDREVRKDAMVGYYGGSPVQRDELTRCDTPVLSIVNNNVLRLDIRGVKTEYAINVTVSDGVNQREVPSDRISQNLNLGAGVYSVVLDSLMDEKNQFKKLGLIPGADLKITVTFSGKENDHSLLSTSASITANSLFETRSQGGEGNTDLVTVACARHLQNLDSAFSGLNDSKVADAMQTASITWPSEGDGPAFQSIHNTNLKSFDGSSLEIRYLRGANGLFADTPEGTTLSGIRIVNPRIESNAGFAGVLVGILGNNSVVTDCGVYCSKYSEHGPIDYNAYRSFRLSATGTAGGLIGSASGCTITRSFSALPSIEAPGGGGLVGSATGCTITDSYANCDDLPESETFFYFLSGSANSVTRCYAMGNQAADTQGYFCNNGGNDILNSYYAVSHLNPSVDPTDESSLLAPSQFVYLNRNDSVVMTQEVMDAMRLSGGWGSLSAPLSHPYIQRLDGRSFPFPAIPALDHYGSWPDELQLVYLSVQLLQHPSLEKVPDAALVQVYDVTTPQRKLLIDSRYPEQMKEPLGVPVGTRILVDVHDVDNALTFYRITYNNIAQSHSTNEDAGKTYYETTSAWTANQDIAIKVMFRRAQFDLTLQPAQGGPADQDLSYLVNVDGKQWSSKNNTDGLSVGAGSTVAVLPKTVNGYQCMVWYTSAGVDYYLPPDENGQYLFPMPIADAQLHVAYTTVAAEATIHYHLRDPETGVNTPLYDDTTKEMTVQKEKFGSGTVINQQLIDRLAESHCPTLDGIQVFSRAHYSINGQKNGSYTVNDRTPVTIDIYLERVKCTVTLKAGDNVGKVFLQRKPQGNSAPEKIDGTGTPSQVTQEFFYGAELTAGAKNLRGQFLAWEPDGDLIPKSASQNYTFQVPYYKNLTMTASAGFGMSLVTVNLLENDESWLLSSPSRQAHEVTVWLESSKDHSLFQLENVQKNDSSYLATGLVPSIAELNKGYHVFVTYAGENTRIYFNNSDGTPKLLPVRRSEETADLHFYSVSYDPKVQYYEGILPESRTYPQYYSFNVPTGALRNKTPGDPNTFFRGWKDSYATSSSSQVYLDGDSFTLTRKTDFFANWVGKLQVVYDGSGMTSGNLPVDNQSYTLGQLVTVKGNPTMRRTGHTFKGWALTPDAATPNYQPGVTFVYTGSDSSPITLYAVWEKEHYTVTFCDINQTPLPGDAYNFQAAYMDSVTLPDYPEHPEHPPLQGWRAGTSAEGNLVEPGQSVTITGKTTFYPVFNEEPITVSFWSKDGSKLYGTQKLLQGYGGYLECPHIPAGLSIAAWSTEENCSGEFYLCDGTGRSLSMVTFMDSVNLYAVDAKVYNYDIQQWYNTLYEAVNGATADNQNLIIYGDTEETQRIEFTHNLYILANGSRTVKWTKAENANSQKEYVGVMYIGGHEVAFGRSYNSNPNLQSLEGNALTFDANKQSRVMALGSGAKFHMYDGVTLTNGERNHSNPDDGKGASGRRMERKACGGGVYAGADSAFYMHGGTISRCKAFLGGGVYLYTGSRMTLGDMVHPTQYSATAIYYDSNHESVSGVGPENYTDYFVTQGSPSIEYCTATRPAGDDPLNYGDGGGGLLMFDLADGDLTLYRGRIYGNHANANGGGILTDGANDTTNLRIYEVDISHNSADGYGGGIFQWQGTVYIYNSTLRQNYSGRSGGGIYLHNNNHPSNIEFHYGDIADNQAVENGGGVYVEEFGILTNYLEFTIYEGANLLNNIAGGYGGGVYLEEDRARLYLSSGTVSGNTASGVANDVYLDKSTVIDSSAIYALPGGLQMSKPVYVSLSTSASEYCTVVEYDTSADFKAEDADFFRYLSVDTNASPYVVAPTEKWLSGDLTAPLILRKNTGNARDVVFHRNSSQDDSTIQTIRQDLGTSITNFPTSFQKEGCFLVGWAKSPDAIEEEQLFHFDPLSGKWRAKDGTLHDAPTYQVTRFYGQHLYAIWQPYSVYYDLNTTNRDAAISAPYSPIVNGYTQILAPTNSITYDGEGFPYSFLGWSTNKDAKTPEKDADGNLLYPATGSAIPMEATGNRILYAVWQKNSSQVTYHLRDGAVSEKHPGEAVISLEKPRFEAANSTFYIYVDDLKITYQNSDDSINNLDGWAEAEDGPVVARAGDTYSIQEAGTEIHLYSVAKPAARLDFLEDHVTPTSMQVDLNTPVDLPVPGRWQDANGIYHRFKSWGTKETEDSDPVPLSDNTFAQSGVVKLYPIWEECYLVTYDDGTKKELTQEVPISDGADTITFTPAPPSPESNSPDRDFLHWVNKATNQEYTVGTPAEITENLKLEAVWSVTVTLNLNDGTSAAIQSSMIQGASFAPPIDKTRKDCQFYGWMDSAKPDTFYCTGENHTENPSFTADKHTTLIAVWSATVSFADSELRPVGVQLYDFTAPITLPTNELQATGKKFVGWTDDNVTVYAPGTQYPVTKNVQLAPVWSATVTFETDGGNAVIDPESVLSISPDLPLSGFHPGEKEGYVFTGWRCGEEEYAVDDTIRVETDTTLTAIWEPAATVQFLLGDEILASDTLVQGSMYTLPGTAENLWDYNGTEHEGGEEITVNSDMTFTAVIPEDTPQVNAAMDDPQLPPADSGEYADPAPADPDAATAEGPQDPPPEPAQDEQVPPSEPAPSE